MSATRPDSLRVPLDRMPGAVAVVRRARSEGASAEWVGVSPRFEALVHTARGGALFAEREWGAAIERALLDESEHVLEASLRGEPHRVTLRTLDAADGTVLVGLERAAADAAHFQAIVEESPDIIAMIDRQFRHVYVNRAITPATGMTPADFEGKDHRDLGMPEELIAYFQGVYRRVFETGQEGAKEFEFPKPDGETRCYSSRVVPLFEPDGRCEVVLSYARDVTERKHAETAKLALERKIQETQRLESLGLLAGGIAHDFNNILMSILGTVSLARVSRLSGGALDDAWHQIESGSMRAADLCRQMLAYAGRGPVLKENVDLGRSLRETAQLLASSSPMNARVELDLDPSLPPVLVDRGQLQQVTMNLLLNALEALPERSGSVRVRGRMVSAAEVPSDAILRPEPAAGPFVAIEVHDQGSGMDEATLARIFDPFFTTKFTGRGLGLAATRGIVSGHGGGLHVTSRSGEGTIFTLYLQPAEGEAVTGPVSSDRSPGSSVRVLVVDDEKPVRDVMTKLLEAAGHQVLVASDGHEGLRVFDAEREGGVDVALVDLTLPGIDGIETLTRLRARAPGLPAVLMSGFSAEDVARRIAVDERTRFLQKPFRFEQLVEVLSAALDPV